MIVFIYGTTAEAIKIAPVARRLKSRGIPYESWVTYQHTDSLRTIIPELGLDAPTRVIADGNRGRPLRSSFDVLRWLASVATWTLKNARSIRKSMPKGSVVVVHGDTLTTALGVMIARRLGLPSAHIEAGLRSGNWRHPFPEELDRRFAGRFATIHYPPSREAVDHLAGRKNVVYTHGNTVIDAVLDQGHDAHSEGAPYGVVLLHRYEFVSNKQLVERTFDTLVSESPVPLKLLVDAYSGHGLQETLDRHADAQLTVQGKLRHPEFIGLLKGASFIVTDSGGIQAESALLGVPTLIHRRAVEQREGIGENIVLSEWNIDRLGHFLANFEDLRREVSRPEESPSDVIVEDLCRRGFCK